MVSREAAERWPQIVHHAAQHSDEAHAEHGDELVQKPICCHSTMYPSTQEHRIRRAWRLVCLFSLISTAAAYSVHKEIEQSLRAYDKIKVCKLLLLPAMLIIC